MSHENHEKSKDHGIAVFANFVNHGMNESAASWLDAKLQAEMAEIARLVVTCNRAFARALVNSAPASISEIEQAMCIASWKAARKTLSEACRHDGQEVADGFCKTCLTITGSVSMTKYNDYLVKKVRGDLKSSLAISSLSKKEKDTRLNLFTRVFTTLLLRDLV